MGVFSYVKVEYHLSRGDQTQQQNPIRLKTKDGEIGKRIRIFTAILVQVRFLPVA